MNPQASKEGKPLMGRLLRFFRAEEKHEPTAETPAPKKKPMRTVLEKMTKAIEPYSLELPEGRTLIDGTPRTVGLNGRNHTIVFTHRRIVLDAKNYVVTCEGTPWDITKAERTAGMFTLEAGAFGKKSSFEADDTKLKDILRTLLSTGTYAWTAEGGNTVKIERQ